mmetsp:Transcript_35270/g.51825  ORF Transcript_35270/g.51825 Transcript_35270/m.51825 type:complete len:308 (+) Transcript_35270:132-1055(+)|eukprot:CAMPEP_0195512846 /NCGR_PEP_ID=MMETSP0794_2-20130614/4661_1 /TAXON_ID=515487 /ORGANISM="Stephanopyxis turris, Strain CCMP 815" /LENGTH=307 /DNA_ID=CAMNT_0040640719 /DNA_START=130 /DNA_END=1053 /DNA_ORIENTATION=+
MINIAAQHCKRSSKLNFTILLLMCFAQVSTITSFTFAQQTRIKLTATAPLESTADSEDNGNAFATQNPSEAFGSPLSKEIKEFNSNAVEFLKTVVFDTAFSGEDREYARFYALETIARMPYFSYLSVLHLYETLGWWRKANYLKIHFAESWNELHHLLIMEELGGSKRWSDRFIAQHIAVAYYWMVVLFYMYNPTFAYNVNQHVEEHAYTTYDNFIREHGEKLKTMPAPQVAKDYYRDGDLYMFDEFQTSTCEPRRPKMENLFDTFVAIRDDEAEHVKTMTNLQTHAELTSTNDDSCIVPEEAFELA